MKDTYNVSLYERNVQVEGLRSIDAPILIDTIRTGIHLLTLQSGYT